MNRIPVLGKVFVFEKSGVFLFATFISFGIFLFCYTFQFSLITLREQLFLKFSVGILGGKLKRGQLKLVLLRMPYF